MAEAKLDCPECGKQVMRIAYAVNFMVIDGVRYRTSATWNINHDGDSLCKLYDGERTVGSETPYGVVWEWDPELRTGGLRDLQSGEIVLRWQEPEQERASS